MEILYKRLTQKYSDVSHDIQLLSRLVELIDAAATTNADTLDLSSLNYSYNIASFARVWPNFAKKIPLSITTLNFMTGQDVPVVFTNNIALIIKNMPAHIQQFQVNDDTPFTGQPSVLEQLSVTQVPEFSTTFSSALMLFAAHNAPSGVDARNGELLYTKQPRSLTSSLNPLNTDVFQLICSFCSNGHDFMRVAFTRYALYKNFRNLTPILPTEESQSHRSEVRGGFFYRTSRQEFQSNNRENDTLCSISSPSPLKKWALPF